MCCECKELRAWGPSFQRSHETKELALQRELLKNAARLEKTSHAGIIRIGFEGISQPHTAWSTPVSIAQLKHHTRAIGKFDERLVVVQLRRDLKGHDFSPANWCVE